MVWTARMHAKIRKRKNAGLYTIESISSLNNIDTKKNRGAPTMFLIEYHSVRINRPHLLLTSSIYNYNYKIISPSEGPHSYL